MTLNGRNGPPCSVCVDARREDIDRRLKAGATLRALAAELGISKSALARHGKHAPPSKPVEKQEVRSGASARPQQPKPPRGKRRALEGKERDLVALLEGQARRLLEDVEADDDLPQRDRAALIASATRTLQAAHTMRAARDEPREVSEAEIVATPAFRTLLDRFIEALRPFPAAARAMIDAIEEGR